jgi:hypothetical protein
MRGLAFCQLYVCWYRPGPGLVLLLCWPQQPKPDRPRPATCLASGQLPLLPGRERRIVTNETCAGRIKPPVSNMGGRDMPGRRQSLADRLVLRGVGVRGLGRGLVCLAGV